MFKGLFKKKSIDELKMQEREEHSKTTMFKERQELKAKIREHKSARSIAGQVRSNKSSGLARSLKQIGGELGDFMHHAGKVSLIDNKKKRQ